MAGSKAGRPSKLNKIPRRFFEELYKIGKTDAEVAEILEVSDRTVDNWKAKNDKFFRSLKEWKSEADLKVEMSLYKRAIGYEFDEVTYEKSKTGGLGIKLNKEGIEGIKHVDTNKVKITTKQIVPDVTAQIFWLKNRKPADWRDVKEHKHEGEIVISTRLKDARDRVISRLAKYSEN